MRFYDAGRAFFFLLPYFFLFFIYIYIYIYIFFFFGHDKLFAFIFSMSIIKCMCDLQWKIYLQIESKNVMYYAIEHRAKGKSAREDLKFQFVERIVYDSNYYCAFNKTRCSSCKSVYVYTVCI